MDQYISEAMEYLGKKYFTSPISFECVDDPSRLEVIKKEGKIIIRYGQRSSLFYGLTLVKENSKKESYAISLNRHFDTNGLMHDCSRNGALNDEQIKRMVLVSALFGLNRFMLYIEDIYQIPEEPYFGYFRGRYTKEELKPLLEYAKGFGVTIIPCIQTLAHLNGMLKWVPYWDIFDADDVIRPGDKRTYELIKRMLVAIKDIFQTDTVHIGMDEARALGVSRFINKNVMVDKKKEFLMHLNKVCEICEEVGIKPMMWSDMFFQLDMGQTAGTWYQHKGPFSDEIKSLIPDVGLVYWDYSNTDISLYRRLLKTLKETGKDTYYASGAISWIGFAPNIVQSLEITRVGLKAALQEKIKNVFVTSWGDNGNECSVITSYPAMALHALYDYEGRVSDTRLSRLLKAVTGDKLSLWQLLQLPNDLNHKMTAYINPSKCYLYQDVLTGIFDNRVKDHYAKTYEEHARTLAKASKSSAKSGYIYKNLANLCSLLAVKVDIGVRLRKAYKAKDIATLNIIRKDLKEIEKRLIIFTDSMRYQWGIENKPFGFDITDGRLGFLMNRIKTAQITLSDYLNKKIPSIPELEEDVLDWQGYDPDVDRLIGYWTEMASVNTY